ncbi:uncharacterized protein LOC131169384 [Hevea brasiliensis]|uniref:uncharacterized protein LOC131169384 n=1 Tax=Hevea brasiliensis TaxID=3981 RepID=UPI0025D44C3C|nr:uncharacterized protein LOC131169384 [Hevea brasiliensis]
MRFGKKEMLEPRYIGPFEITDREGAVAYQLELPPNLSYVHPVFHISILREYASDSSHVLQPDIVELNENLTFVEQLVAIVDYQIRQLRSRQIPTVKVLWRSQSVEEFTWESKQNMRNKYPYLFDI